MALRQLLLWPVAAAWAPLGPRGREQCPVGAPEAQLRQEVGGILSLWVACVQCPCPFPLGFTGLALRRGEWSVSVAKEGTECCHLLFGL